MKNKFLLFFTIFSIAITAQESPNDYSRNFSQELKVWKESFSNMNLKNFKQVGITELDDQYNKNESFEELDKVYKIIGSYSPNKTKFVNIYSDLNLEKKGEFYQAMPEVDQYVDVYLIEENKNIRVFNGGSSQGIDEVFWVSENKLLLVGTSYFDEKTPIILIVDFITKKVTSFENDASKSIKKYKSPQLNKIKIID